MTYYPTPEPNETRYPEDHTCADNFSSAIAAYADVPESSESDWLQYGSPSQVDDNDPTEAEMHQSWLPWCDRD